MPHPSLLSVYTVKLTATKVKVLTLIIILNVKYFDLLFTDSIERVTHWIILAASVQVRTRLGLGLELIKIN